MLRILTLLSSRMALFVPNDGFFQLYGHWMKSTPILIRKAEAAFSPSKSTIPVSFLARNFRKSLPSLVNFSGMDSPNFSSARLRMVGWTGSLKAM